MNTDEIIQTIETWLSTLTGRPGIQTVELAFFGGSFTGIPIEQQSRYLKIAQSYKKRNLINKIHLSTRPDYIDERILENLKAFGVDTIELGVQSFDDNVLAASGRGHDSAAIYHGADLIQQYQFELGIQLMIGLPADSLEKCLYSARETVKIGPSIARLYPTIIIEDTKLMEMYKSGQYEPLSAERAIFITKEMYKILTKAGIHIIRVGLKSSDLIREGGQIQGHTFHPAFRQLVEGQIAREKMETLLNHIAMQQAAPCGISSQSTEITFFSSSKWFSCMIGHKGCNKTYFKNNFPRLTIHYNTRTLPDGQIAVAVAGTSHLMVE